MMRKRSLQVPARLRPGDQIAVISPAAPTTEEGAFEKGTRLLEEAGFHVRLMPHAKRKTSYLAGEDTERLADLHGAFEDPEIKGVLCARGGYGAMRLLPHLDFERLANYPKVFIGFSDITVLHMAFYQEMDRVGFYGPMLTSNLVCGEPFSQQCLLDMIQGNIELPYLIPNQDTYQCFRPGVAEGRLIGGNLSLLTALCGTPWQPKTQGHLLFIEDWKEKYYSLDRQFQQLKLAGLFEGIQGLILCDFSDIEPEPEFSQGELLRRLTDELSIPVGYGFSVGHGEQTATLPIGIQCRFDASQGTLTLLEMPVR